MNYEVHPACAAIPLPPEQEIDELANSIKLSGLREPITLTKDNLLLDGRCRLKACTIAGVEVRTEIFEGDDPVMFVLDKNIRRRHLTEAQRGLAIAALANLQNGSNQFRRKGKEGITIRNTLSIEDVAKKHGVSHGVIMRSATILKKGAPHVVEMVADGKVKPYIAAEAVRHTSREAQANWTVEDVIREGGKTIKNPPNKRKKATQQPSAGKSQVDPFAGRRLSQIDPGPHGRRGDQRVFIWPPHIQDLMDDQSRISADVIGPLLNFRPVVEDGWTSTPEVIGAALKRLLAHKPKPVGGFNGEDIDFAAKLRKQVKQVTDGRIRRAIDWLTGVEAAIAEALS